MKKLLFTLTLFAAMVSGQIAVSAADAAPKAPSLEDRIADLEA